MCCCFIFIVNGSEAVGTLTTTVATHNIIIAAVVKNFFVTAPLLWNALPKVACLALSLMAFRHRMRMELFRQAFNWTLGALHKWCETLLRMWILQFGT